MATYAIGDLQGCIEPLERLLRQVDFRPGPDRLWFVGDLVNRGPDSLRCLRFVRDLGAAATTVLGNHDLHLLAVALAGRAVKRGDTLDDILSTPDRDVLMAWLRRQPLLLREGGFNLVHAGILPEWTGQQAEALAAEVAAELRGPHAVSFLNAMYGNDPCRWSPELSGMARLRFVTNALTRLRFVTADGALDMAESSPPGTQAAGLTPWYAVPGRASAGEAVVFGHWATLQTLEALDPAHGVHHLDSGCVWGRELSALRLEDGSLFSVPCPGA